jgi:methyl acetate hydrolase
VQLQDLLDRNVADGRLPFVVATAADRDGVLFSGASGGAAPGLEADDDTQFRIFSMTKAVCATAAMIQIERGELDPECPVEDILPDFASLRMLEGWHGAEPVLRAPSRKATVRHLVTHTSGLEYELWNDQVATYMERTGHPSVISGTRTSLQYPMMSEPGTRWAYGPNFDWLGRVVEAVDGRDITAFCRAEIFEPLAMHKTLFEIGESEARHLSAVCVRAEHGGFAPIEIAPPSGPEFYSMGHGLYATAPDFIRFLRMLLNRGQLDGNRILSPEALNFMLADHGAGLDFAKMVSCSPMSANFDPFPGVRHSASFGFLRNEEDIDGMRSAGSQGWAGMLNSHYWFDPARGVAAVFMTQMLPFADPDYLRCYEEFERAVYSQLP